MNISGHKGGKIGFLVVLEALGSPEGECLHPRTPGLLRGEHTQIIQISRGKPRGVKNAF
jgi:hypothetical protein